MVNDPGFAELAIKNTLSYGASRLDLTTYLLIIKKKFRN